MTVTSWEVGFSFLSHKIRKYNTSYGSLPLKLVFHGCDPALNSSHLKSWKSLSFWRTFLPIKEKYLQRPTVHFYRTPTRMKNSNSTSVNLEVMHGPQQYGEASFRHLYTEQGVGQVLTFLRHWRSDSQASSLLRIAVSWLQLSLSTGVSFLQDVTTAHPHCEAKWLASLRLFLASINGSIDLDETFAPLLQRERDFYLMDDLLSSGDFNDKQLFR